MISLSPESMIHPRHLAHSMLGALETRGWDAAGWAYGRSQAAPVYYKNDVPGGYLDMHRMTASANSVILHTRMGTHGTARDNRNNHPVLSPDRSIALVHNGVLWNHDTLRKGELSEFWLPEVDSSVAPALIQKYGVEGLSKLSGDAAVIWMSADTGRVIHLARVEHSPFTIAQLGDGSIVGASTTEILAYALEDYDPDIDIKWVRELDELDYLQILDGTVLSQERLAEPVGYHYGYSSKYRGVTSGKQSMGGGTSLWDPDDWPTDGALTTDPYEDWNDPAKDWTSDDTDDLWGYEIRKALQTDKLVERFYVTDHEGNDVTFSTAQEMLDYLDWFGSRFPIEPMFPELDDGSGWVNWFGDIGEIDNIGGVLSWVAHREQLDEHDAPMSVRDGVDVLKRYVI